MRSGGRVWLRLIAAALVAATACGSGGRADRSGGKPGADATTTTATDGGGGSPPTHRPGPGTTTAPRGGAGTTAPADGGSGGSTTTAAAHPPTTAGSTPVGTGARNGVGAYARWLLQPQRAQRVVVEVLVQHGAEPRQGSLDHVVSTLREVAGKPVSLSGPVSLPAGDDSTGDDEIRSLADRHGRAAQTPEQAVVRLLFLTGRYRSDNPDDAVIGVAVRGDTAAVFTERVQEASTPIVSRTALEAAVTMHEVGHLLGLVDLALHTGREDPEHRGHSRNRKSVMYWAIESLRVSHLLGEPPPRDFDAADLADLAAIRNGG
jgi:hypothetical protein